MEKKGIKKEQRKEERHNWTRRERQNKEKIERVMKKERKGR